MVMSEIRVYGFDGASVRVVVGQDGEPWFVASDVCRVLEIVDVGQALDRLDDDERGRCSVPTPGGTQAVRAVTESGLYSLILGSRKPEAKRFKRWVTHEVLPSIRRTGAYGERDMITALSDPSTLRTLLSSYAERVLALEAEADELRAEVEVAKPKASALDRIATRGRGSLCVTDAAKALQVGPRTLFRWLSGHRWIYRRAGAKNWLAYQEKVQQGLLEHKVTTVRAELDGEERIYEQVLVTPKGLARLAELLERENAETSISGGSAR